MLYCSSGTGGRQLPEAHVIRHVTVNMLIMHSCCQTDRHSLLYKQTGQHQHEIKQEVFFNKQHWRYWSGGKFQSRQANRSSILGFPCLCLLCVLFAVGFVTTFCIFFSSLTYEFYVLVVFVWRMQIMQVLCLCVSNTFELLPLRYKILSNTQFYSALSSLNSFNPLQTKRRPLF